jgi:hypothetical protein
MGRARRKASRQREASIAFCMDAWISGRIPNAVWNVACRSAGQLGTSEYIRFRPFPDFRVAAGKPFNQGAPAVAAAAGSLVESAPRAGVVQW